MNRYIEEMVSSGLAQPRKLKGTPWAVFRMIQVLAEYKLFHRDPLGWQLWLVNKEN